jgi:hypothetical protein
MKKPLRIPTIFGIILLLSGLFVGIFAVQQGQNWFLRASPEEQPKEMRITNVSDNSFTISWITDTAVRGFVKYGEAGGSLPDIASDERDAGRDNQSQYDTHYVNVSGLSPDTTYEFKIGSGARLYDNNGIAFRVKTAPLVQSGAQGTDLVSGTVEYQGQAIPGVIVYFENSSLTPLSAVSKSTGAFTIPLTGARLKNLTGIYTGLGDNDTFDLFVEGGSRGKATAVVSMKNREGIPVISIPGNYDYSGDLLRDSSGAIILPSVTPISSSGGTAAAPTLVPASRFTFDDLPEATESDEITVLYPSFLERVNVASPEFFGTAPPGKTLTITVEPDTQSGQATSNSSGDWRWSPSTPFTSAEHTLTISYVDKTGTLRKIVRRFTVAIDANIADNNIGAPRDNDNFQSDLEFTSSPSATLAPSPTAIPTATPTNGDLPTPTGTITVTTATPTRTPTPTITTRAALPDTSSGIPTAGTWELTAAVAGAGGVLILGGLSMLVRSKRGV